jgi:NtrC-family two-component system response regulator AlgB
MGRPVPELSESTGQIILGYPWPGNIRELRNALERAAIVWPSGVLEPEALPARVIACSTTAAALGGDFDLERIEYEHISRVMARTATLEEASRILGIDASTLWRKRKKYEKGEC